MSLLSQNKIVLDIGHHDCKIAEYKVSPKEIVLVRRDVLTPLDFYLNKGKLVNVEDFVKDVLKFLALAGFTSKSLVLTGSALDIQCLSHDWEAPDQKALNNKYKELTSKASDRLTSIYSWQIFGQEIVDNKYMARVATASIGRDTLDALCDEFSSYSYKVESVIPEEISIQNLIKLSSDTHERPGRFILNLGSNISMNIIIRNLPKETLKLQTNFSRLMQMMEKRLGLSNDEAHFLLFKAGFIDDATSRSSLEYLNVDAVEYFNILIEFARDLANEIKGQMDAKSNTYKLNKYRIMFIGGYADIPGITQSLGNIFQCETLEFETAIANGYEYEGKIIRSINKFNLKPNYMQTLGCLLGPQFKQHIDLAVSKGSVVDILPLVKFLPPVACALLACLVVYSGFTWIGLNSEVEDLESKASKVSGLQSQVTSLNNQIGAIDIGLEAMSGSDSVIPEIINFVDTFADSQLRIASVDSQNVLANADDGGSVSVSVEEETDGDAPSGALGRFSDTSAKQYTIRGYSLDADTAVSFVDNLRDSGIVEKCDLTGIDGVYLNMGSYGRSQHLYLFEVVVWG